MFKRFFRWILPLVILVLIAAYFVLSPLLATHAAPVAPAPIISPQGPLLDWIFYH